MKLNKIKLYNIGPFINDVAEMDLSVSSTKNIVLIGGKNGAGKTTLLNSFKVCLFGSYSLGYKSNNATYQNYLSKILNYEKTLEKKSNHFIELDFSVVEEFKKVDYNFFRGWETINGRFIEELIITKNGVVVHGKEYEEIQERMRVIIPPQVIDSLLFDGEEVANIIKNKELDSFLKELCYNLFNITQYSVLESDLRRYQKRQSEKKLLTADELKLLSLQDQLKALKSSRESFKKQLIKSTSSKTNLLQKIEEKTSKFKNLGGLSNDEEEEISVQLNIEEKSKKEFSSKVRSFLENEYLFAVNKNSLSKVEAQLQHQKPLELLKYIDELEDYSNEIMLNDIRCLLESKSKSSYFLHDSSVELESMIRKKMAHIKSNPIESIYHEYLQNNSSKNTQKKLRSILKGNSESKELEGIYDNILSLRDEVEEINVEIDRVVTAIDTEENKIEMKKLEITTAEEKISANEKEESSFELSIKVLKSTQKFKQKILDSKLKQVEEAALMKFNQISRKKNYVSSILIDRDTFDVSTLDNLGALKPISLLSAGESQVLMGAIIWAVYKVSRRNLMFIIDTPLARLDSDNQLGFVRYMIKEMGEQILILSTDKEIIGNLYDEVHHNTSKEYLITNFEDKRRSMITEEYFEVI